MNGIVKGFLVAFNNQTKKAQVQGDDGNLYVNVILINPIGTHTIPQITETSGVLLFKSMGSNSKTYGLLFDFIQQQEKLPVQNNGDYAIGSLVGQNNITFQATGDIKIKATNIDTEAKNVKNNVVTHEITAQQNIKSTSNLGGEVNIGAKVGIKNQIITLLTAIAYLNARIQAITITDPQTGIPIPINNISDFDTALTLFASLLE